jgi:hypothetical protein
MDQETIDGAKRFEEWMAEEEERTKNMVVEMPEQIDKKMKPYITERPKIDRQLRLF